MPYGIDNEHFLTAWADLVLRLRPHAKPTKRSRR